MVRESSIKDIKRKENIDSTSEQTEILGLFLFALLFALLATLTGLGVICGINLFSSILPINMRFSIIAVIVLLGAVIAFIIYFIRLFIISFKKEISASVRRGEYYILEHCYPVKRFLFHIGVSTGILAIIASLFILPGFAGDGYMLYKDHILSNPYVEPSVKVNSLFMTSYEKFAVAALCEIDKQTRENMEVMNSDLDVQLEMPVKNVSSIIRQNYINWEFETMMAARRVSQSEEVSQYNRDIVGRMQNYYHTKCISAIDEDVNIFGAISRRSTLSTLLVTYLAIMAGFVIRKIKLGVIIRKLKKS